MSDSEDSKADETRFGEVPVTVTVVVGTARPAVRTLLELSRDSVIPLENRIDDPVVIYAGDKIIAHGELLEDEGDGDGGAGTLSVRITELLTDNG
ncbi:MAG: FliM/FliN family flagellar motor C-terminal domain-containing protein [Pseudomonadota bacterium]